VRRVWALTSTLAGLIALLALAAVAHAQAAPLQAYSSPLVHTLSFEYRAWDGTIRPAYLMLPAWYGPHDNPTIPLVISPHGRGVDPRINERYWGDLPGRGMFAVVNPSGEGRRLGLYSWGARGDINDLARMPALIRGAFPWVKVDRRRIYAAGSSMGGQETLLLVARHPALLAGAAALDSDTNLDQRYVDFAALPDGTGLRRLLAEEVGGTPRQVPAAYASRSPSDLAHALAFSQVPLQIWWSRSDRIVVDQAGESGKLFEDVVRANPAASATETVGTWAHSCELARALPIVLTNWGITLAPSLPNAAPPTPAALCAISTADAVARS
jgi:hypothetical protein